MIGGIARRERLNMKTVNTPARLRTPDLPLVEWDEKKDGPAQCERPDYAGSFGFETVKSVEDICRA
jgi:hypothetical protein